MFREASLIGKPFVTRDQDSVFPLGIGEHVLVGAAGQSHSLDGLRVVTKVRKGSGQLRVDVLVNQEASLLVPVRNGADSAGLSRSQ